MRVLAESAIVGGTVPKNVWEAFDRDDQSAFREFLDGITDPVMLGILARRCLENRCDSMLCLVGRRFQRLADPLKLEAVSDDACRIALMWEMNAFYRRFADRSDV